MLNSIIKGTILGLGLIIFLSNPSDAQNNKDTIRYSVIQLEDAFLKQNLLLLAEKLNIDQAEAKIMQAKVWPNPTFSLDEVQLYVNATADASPGIIGDFMKNRQFSVKMEQLILTAGKRKKNINLEVQNKELAQNMFTDMLYALKAELRKAISEIIYLQQIQQSWQVQYKEVSRLIKSRELQFQNGFISQADLMRLKALQISLKGELTELGMQMSEAQQDLKTLINLESNSIIAIEETQDQTWIAALKSKTIEELNSISQQHNPQLKALESELKVSEAAYQVELAQRAPNLNFNALYDRNAATQLNFVGLGVSFDLPIFDRNKGNIKAAKLKIDQSRLMHQNYNVQLNQNILKHLTDLKQSVSLYESIDLDYMQKLDALTMAIGKNYAERNISLLQFLDYYESFRDSKEHYYNVLRKISQQKEELNYLTGNNF